MSSVILTGSEIQPPHASVDKPFLLSDGKVELEASLNKAIYHHGEPVLVTVTVRNNSGKTVRRIKVKTASKIIKTHIAPPRNCKYF